MSSSFLINLFISIHMLALAGFMISFMLRLSAQKKIINVSPSQELVIGNLLLAAVLVLPLIFATILSQTRIQPIVHTVVASTFHDFDSLHGQTNSGQIVIGGYKNETAVSVDNVRRVVLVISLFAFLVFAAKNLFEFRRLRTLLENSLVGRRFGRVRVLYSGDTTWQFAYQIIKSLLGVNPAIHQWLKIFSELQELKVDKVLVDRKKVSQQEYACCLIEVAESVVFGKEPLVCATSVAFLPERHQLTRRIESMFNTKVKTKFTAFAVAMSSFVALSALAMTTTKTVGAHTLSFAEAEKLAEATRGGEFPVVMNKHVLEQLNRFVGTAQGREYIRKGIARMKTYRSLIESKLKDYDVPEEILAIPLVESDYQNLSQKSDSSGAGLWQFIAPTAESFGLVVDNHVDERLDVEKETDAAMRLLLSGKVRFKNWPLSAIAYNAGDVMVSQGIMDLKSYDAWTLIDNGYEGDRGYLAKVEAAILILKNPYLVR
jgi:beta-lactamase regulating signal transducer with metallopeptidase domain